MVLLPGIEFRLWYVNGRWFLDHRKMLVTSNLVSCTHTQNELHLSAKRNWGDRAAWRLKTKTACPCWCVCPKENSKHVIKQFFGFVLRCALRTRTVFRLDAHIFVSPECDPMCVGYTYVKANGTACTYASSNHRPASSREKRKIRVETKNISETHTVRVC